MIRYSITTFLFAVLIFWTPLAVATTGGTCVMEVKIRCFSCESPYDATVVSAVATSVIGGEVCPEDKIQIPASALTGEVSYGDRYVLERVRWINEFGVSDTWRVVERKSGCSTIQSKNDVPSVAFFLLIAGLISARRSRRGTRT